MAQITLNSSGVASNGSLLLQTNGTTTAVTIDTAGNMGLGVTPSAWASGYKAFDVSTAGSFTGTSSGAQIWSNTADTATGSRYKNTAAAGTYQISGATHAWYNAASGTAGNAVSFTQAMTLDASGILLNGVTGARGSNKLQVLGSLTAYTSAGISLICGNGASQLGSNGPMASINVLLSNNWKTNLQFLVNTSDTDTAPVEVGRFDSSGGFILVGSTAQKATGTTWSNPSDQRLKDNIRDYGKGLAELMQVRVREWEFNGKGGTTEGMKGLGVVADEVMTVLPNTVENYNAKLNADDEETTAIKKFDATEITWLLVKTVQEQQAIITQLQADVAALKGTA